MAKCDKLMKETLYALTDEGVFEAAVRYPNDRELLKSKLNELNNVTNKNELRREFDELDNIISSGMELTDLQLTRYQKLEELLKQLSSHMLSY